ncbi:PREDICTED: sacsin-like [Nanorana parkeri]|uniref:sacsin-like n=1 Tax=Nanorana parkeri TaxID=125878 RepID=UPI000854907A|nr:PREDICTED: sacsin-like [Nanorana parkeri]
MGLEFIVGRPQTADHMVHDPPPIGGHTLVECRPSPDDSSSVWSALMNVDLERSEKSECSLLSGGFPERDVIFAGLGPEHRDREMKLSLWEEITTNLVMEFRFCDLGSAGREYKRVGAPTRAQRERSRIAGTAIPTHRPRRTCLLPVYPDLGDRFGMPCPFVLRIALACRDPVLGDLLFAPQVFLIPSSIAPSLHQSRPNPNSPERGNFFQRAPPFLIQLQNILRKYPDGGQILKELIQNADDAKATEVIFAYDERQYGTESLHSEDLHIVQGPALLAYNNEIFSDQDWDGIQRPGNSVKRKDPDTVGRFGLGFNSVYHITDFPAIFSGTNIGFLDPQEEIFHRGGRRWNLEKGREDVDRLSDQFQPFQEALEALGLGDWEEILDSGHFNGTLFRFPLRLDPSEISENIYDSGRVQELFESFIRDASISLLFLRHVTRVSLKNIDSVGALTTLLTVEVSTEETFGSESADLDIKTHIKVTSLNRFGGEQEDSKWLVTSTTIQGNMFPELTELSNKLCNKPALDLAYPLSEACMDLYGGRLSCVLPLPDKEENRTGLPLVINGCFDLTDDRRSLKWPEVDQQHDEAAKWNHILVEQVLPLLYTHAVRNTVSLVKSSKISADVTYSIWPDPEKTQHKRVWHNLTRQMAESLVKERVFQMVDQSRWITASEAVFLLERDLEDSKIRACLEKVLLLLGVTLVKVPRHVYSTLQLAAELKSVSPSLVRQSLRKDGWHGVPRENKMALLKYAISDGRYQELLNLQLLPLANGEFTSFQNTESSAMVYIDSRDFPRILLPGLAHRFIPEDLTDDLRLFFTNVGKAKTFRNLAYLNEELVLRRLHEALPQRWRDHPDLVTWNPQERDSPPVRWITSLWTFLQRYPTLDLFEDHPIVPINPVTDSSSNVKLARLKKKTTLLLQSQDRTVLADCTSKILEKAGCTIIRDKNSWLWHKNLDVYLLAPTPNNILRTLGHLNSSQITKALTNAPKAHIKLFCEVLSQAYSLTSSELQILHKLPIFCSAPCVTAPSSKLVAAGHLAAVANDAFPAVPDSLMFPDVVIKCRDASDRRLLQLMQIGLLGATDMALLIAKAVPNGTYSAHPAEIERAMLWILRNGHVLFSQNGQLKNICCTLSFLPCNGSLKQASALFDPNVDILKELFEAHKFPPSNYREDLVLESLKQLGMKDSIHKITADDVLQIAETLSRNAGHMSSPRKAQALIRVCNETTVLAQFTPQNLKRLRSLSWVPSKIHDSPMAFGKPENLRDFTYCDIVEHAMPLTNDFKKQASDFLGLSQSPPPGKVIESLKVLGEKYSRVDPYSLEGKLHKTYKYIQDHLHLFPDNLLSQVIVWTGDGFSRPDEIFLAYPEGLDLSSFTKKVPPAYLTYQNLFSKCGVQKTLSSEDVVNVLYVLKRRLGDARSDFDTSKDLKLAVLILDWMKTNSVHGTDDLPIPVQSKNNEFGLEALSKTLFCDIDKQSLAGAFDTNCFIVHDEVSMATAKFLNIQLLSTKVLKPEFFEPWGPIEPVTLRIKNILREYSEHSEVFKEFLQNADDADATVCKFLVDRRENLDSRQTLIDPGMASSHGPALWSYNNRKFTDKDFVNITRIGAATKETQAQKIGKFGLGFNTVYHITDVPAIMSRSTIIIFDPNVNHLQKHIPSNNPGMKLDLQKNPEPLRTFPGQFQPFIGVFNCSFAQPFDFDGTLIRLPFRTEEEANKSKICQKAFDEEEINMLVSDFENFADILLIFIKNVKEVELNCLDNGAKPEDQLTKVHLRKEVLESLTVPPTVLLQKEQINASKILNLPMETSDITTSKIIKICVRKAVADDDKYYLVQSSLGVKDSFQMFKQDANIFSYPISGLAIPLKKNHSSGKWSPDLEDFKGMVFCFLPLPVSSGLPFHINASFAVMSNRKSLWDTTVKGDWNKKLLSDALLAAVITALSQLQILHQNGDLQDYCYYTFWPDIGKVNTFFTGAVKSFYQAITFGFGNLLPALFSNGQEWCTIKHACFLELEGFQNKAIESLAKMVFSSVLEKPYLAVILPQWVRESFSACGCLVELQKNFYNTERFYSEILLENLDAIHAKDRDKLVLYAIDLQNKKLDSILKSKPCIPSSNGKLQLIKKLIHPMGKASVLYDPEEGCFPAGDEFLKPERLARLQTLGMLKDRLPIAELMARAGRIKDIWSLDRTKALKQICCILELLNDLLQQEPEAAHCGELRDAIFLPVIPALNNCASSENLTVMNSKGIYHYQHKALVCLVKPVLSKEHLGNVKLSEPLLSFLGLHQPPSFPIVLSQLEEACKAPNLLNQEEMSEVAKRCYKFLNAEIPKQPDHAAQIKEKASSMPFVYADEEFVPLNVVAKKIPFDALPYLHKLPKVYEAFDKLWACVGLRDEFSTEDYFSVLKQMALKNRETPLSANEFKLALHLINNSLEKLTMLNADNPIDAQLVFIPDRESILRPADEIFYYDTPWLPYDEDLNFCHEMVPRAVVSTLGVKTKIHQTLNKLKISGLSKWVLQFGAKEQLTTRIKNIIKEYSSKKDILKELIQNADDSEASEIHFVLDCRTHQTQSTFGPQWNPLQGPALCVYNNKKFEDQDIEGIQQLGIGGKEERLDKTGKFGLGFNSVYHITDCPSFVTGDTSFCVFDPNLMFLDTANDSSPGGMFVVNNKFKITFGDVYDTFLPSFFKLEEGTLFRLPLRSADTVLRSKISDQTSSLEDIKSMCEELQKDADNMILFLSNIRQISFSEITTDGQIKEILSIQSKVNDRDEEMLSSFHQKLSELAGNSVDLSQTMPSQVCYRVQIAKNSSSRVANWLVAKQVGTESMDTLKRISGRLHQTMIPHGAVAAQLDLEIEGRAFCTLPLPLETGLPVHVNANFIVDSARRGICKEDGDSPKTEWNAFLLSNIVAPLYCSLLESLCKIFAKHKREPLIFQSVDSCCFLDRYLKDFPTVTKSVPPQWQTLVKEVYLTIFKRKAQVIPIYKVYEVREKYGSKKRVSVEWSSIGKLTIAEEPIFLSEADHKDIGYILQNINMHLAFGGTINFLCKELKDAGVPVYKLSPQTLCDFLRHCQLLPHGQVLPAPVSMSLLRNLESCKGLLKYCLINCPTKKAIDVQGVPLLVTMDKMLRTFDRNDPKFLLRFSELFPEERNQFAEYNYPLLKEHGFLKSLTIANSVIFVKNHLGPLHDLSSSNSKCGLTLSEEKETWLKKLWEFFQSQIDEQQHDSRQGHFETIVSAYKHWAIVPVCFKQKPKSIISFAHTKDVIYPRGSDVAEFLLKLGFPKLELSFFPYNTIDFLLPHLLDPENVENVLEHLSSRSDVNWELNQNWDLDIFLIKILSQLQSQKKQKNINNLYCLPLFETSDGKRQSLNGFQKIFVLDSEFSSEYLKLSEISSQTVFLKNSSVNKQAAKLLNIPIIDTLQLLTEFLLLHVQHLSENQLLGVLELVLSLQTSREFHNKKEDIYSSLRHVKLIKSKRGALEQVSYFYDHSVKLFSTFGLQEYFIPDDLWTKFERFKLYLETLLLELGIKKSLTEDEVIRFATQVEKESKRRVPSESLPNKAKQLFDYLLSMNVDKLSANFPSAVGKIAFVMPSDVKGELKALHPSFVGKHLTVALKGSLMERNNSQYLVWTSMTLIDKCVTGKKKQEFLEKCGVHLKPPVQKVIENVKNICGAQCDRKHFNSRAHVLKLAYTFFQDHVDEVDSDSFENVPFILVDNDTVLAEARQIVFNLQNSSSFRPYLYKLPPLLACYSNLFQKVGVQAEASLIHFTKVLSAIYEETLDKESLHANLIKTVSETMHQFFKLLENATPKDLEKLGPLYLPDLKGKLYESSDLILNDCRSYMSLLKLGSIFRFLYTDIDQYTMKRLLSLLPVAIRPKLLSEITEESIDNFKECELGEHCAIKLNFTELLISPIFCEGLVCLLCKQSNGKVTREEAEETCSAIFGKIQIKCCSMLQTSLIYENSTLKGTTSKKAVCVRYVDMCCQIYLNHSDLAKSRKFVWVLHSLSSEINKLIGNVLRDSSLGIILQMLACSEPGEMLEVLKEHGVWTKKLETKNAFTLPKPGESIPCEWHDCLDMSVQNAFMVGDYVGYMVPGEDEAYLYARIVEELDADVFGTCELPRYRIDIGQEEMIDVSVLDLYHFKRLSGNNSKALVPLNNPPTQEYSDKWFESSADKIKAEIDLQLSTIWQLPQDQKIKAIRRLYLKYHPDKNIGQEVLSTEIFKYLQQKVKELESGGRTGNHATANNHSGHSSFHGGFSGCWGKWDREASHHRQNRERFSRSTRCDYNFWGYHTGTQRPKPQEAERWMRQAECDLKATENDAGRCTEWVFYKVHQAVEKALFAAQYIKKGKIDKDEDILQLARQVAKYSSGLHQIYPTVAKMKALGVDNRGTQYPSCHSPPKIPNDSFASDKEEEVITLAEDVLRTITGYVRL